MAKYVALMASLYVLNGRVNGLFIWTEIALLMALIPTLKWFCLPVYVCVCTCVCSLALSIPPCSWWAVSSQGIGNGSFFCRILWFPLFYELCASVFQLECLPSLASWKTTQSPKQWYQKKSYIAFPPLPRDTLISDSLFTISPQFEQNVSSLAVPLEITYWKYPSAEVWYYKFSGQLA